MTEASQHSPAPRVAFQGVAGSFSEEAAVNLLGADVTLVPLPTFEALYASIDEGTADMILAPIENTLAGSVRRSLDLLLASSLYITAEVVIPIHLNLIGLPGATFDDVRFVESHPVALAQCELFFAAHPHLKPIKADDTAGSVANIMQHKDAAHAAIASTRAAEIYGGRILRSQLEDHAENYTRFILLDSVPRQEQRADKLSLFIKLPHRPGALHHALLPFAKRSINLLKIESHSMQGSPWRYHFCLDLQAASSDPQSVAALAEMRALADDVRLLGWYKAAQLDA